MVGDSRLQQLDILTEQRNLISCQHKIAHMRAHMYKMKVTEIFSNNYVECAVYIRLQNKRHILPSSSAANDMQIVQIIWLTLKKIKKNIDGGWYCMMIKDKDRLVLFKTLDRIIWWMMRLHCIKELLMHIMEPLCGKWFHWIVNLVRLRYLMLNTSIILAYCIGIF